MKRESAYCRRILRTATLEPALQIAIPLLSKLISASRGVWPARPNREHTYSRTFTALVRYNCGSILPIGEFRSQH